MVERVWQESETRLFLCGTKCGEPLWMSVYPLNRSFGHDLPQILGIYGDA